MVAALTIAVTGTAIIPKRAERALLDIEISSTGFSRAFISEEVQLSCRRLEELLRKTSSAPSSSDAHFRETQDQTVIAHWSMTSMKTTSHLPTDNYGSVLKNAQRVYSTTVGFDIRVRDFSRVGALASQISTLPYTVVHSVGWGLTSATRLAHEGRLRAMAAEDALERAKDYAKALGLAAVWPVEVREVGWGGGESGSGAGSRIQEQGVEGKRPGGGGGADAFAGFLFEPDSVIMSARIDCKFEAE